MHRNLYKKTQTKLFTENRLCFFNTLRSNISEVPRDRAEFHLSYMFNKVTVNKRQVSLQDFILRNTLDSSTSIVDSITFGSNSRDNVTFTDFQGAVQKQFRSQPFAIYMQGKSLQDLINTWVETNADEQERRSFELSLIQPTNIEVVRYKFQELMKYNSIPMWNYIEDYDTATRTQLFMDDPILASQVLESLFVCEPDTLLVSVLSGIRSDLNKDPNETPDQKTNREAACKILSSVCDILNRYSMGYNAGTSIGSSMGEVMNPMASMGFLSGMPELSGSLFDNFGKMSGSEKAIGLIGALIASRAVGHNFPKVSAAIKTGIVAALGAPIVAHLGSKLMHGRSYLEFRKIRALLGGSESNDPTNLIAQICGFDLSAATSDSAKAAIKSNIEGLIDSVVAHESFGNLKFRDVIHAFEPGGNSDSVVTGHIRTTPQIASSLSVVIPRMIAKFENEETPPLARARFYHLMTSQKTWSEGMFLLLSYSAELEDLLNSNSAREEVNETVRKEEIQTLNVTDTNKPLVEHSDHTGELDRDIESEDRNHMLRIQIESLENLPVNHPYSSLFAVNPNNSTDSSSQLKSSVDVTGARYVSFELDIQGKTYTEVQGLLTAAKDRVQAIYPDSNRWNRTLVFSGTNRAGTKLFIGYSVAFEYTEAQLSGSERFRSHINSNLKSLISDKYPHPYGLIYRDLFENIPLSQQFNAILSGEANLQQINAMLPQEAQLNQDQVNLLNGLLQYSNSLGLLDSTKGMISKLLEFNPRRFVSILNDPNTSTLGKINAIASAIRTSSESHTNVLKERTTIYEEFDAAGEQYLSRQTQLNPIDKRLLATQFRFAAVLFTLKRHGVENFNMTTLFGSEYDLTVAGFTQYITAYATQYKSISASAVSRVISTTPVPARRTPSSGGGGSSTPPETQRGTITHENYRQVTTVRQLAGKNYIKVLTNSRLRTSGNALIDFEEVTPKPQDADPRYTYYKRKTAAAPQSGTRSNPTQLPTQSRQAASGFTNTRDNATEISVKASYSNSELHPNTYYKLSVNPLTLTGLTSVYRIRNLQNVSNVWTFTVEKIL